MPKIKINGVEGEFQAGTKIIDACREVGIEIPHFCYHPRLSIAGSCRMCQVEVEQNGRGGLMLSCSTPVADGMEVFTDTEAVLKARKAVLEFLLINHPLDCPICDDAGECKLQNYYLRHDLQKSRMSDPKWKKHKAVDLGPHIVLDSERCVLCSRCVRFMQEFEGKGQLGIFNNGSRSELGALPGKKLEGDYIGNIVDICPVGALTDKRFRFKRRVWYLKSVDSICPGCSKGCNIEIQFDIHHDWKSNGSRIMRFKPRYNHDVNGYFICDRGRYSWDYIDSPDRLLAPLVSGEGELVEADWDTALVKMAKGMKEASSAANRAKSAIIVAPALYTGALFMLQKLVEKMGISNIDYRLPDVKKGEYDGKLKMNDLYPNSYSAKIIGLVPGEGGKSVSQIFEGIKSGNIKYLTCIACDPAEYLGEDGLLALKKLKFFGLMHWTKTPSTAVANVSLPIATFTEVNGVFINYEGRIQRCFAAFEPKGLSKPAWQAILLLGREMGYKFKAFSEGELFHEFTNKHEDYKDYSWDTIGRQGVLLK